MGPVAFVEKLDEEGVIDSCYLDFGTENFEFYYLGGISFYHQICYGVSKAYLSHHSALELWHLSAENNGRSYINQEQSEKKTTSKKSILI
ncbi:hypothetical protein [Pedobacter aquatilis]|uniref:hypothetical protein n=1 Tax=Pedobacter aquatilis TaxID=351343 RepID=UPI00292CC225|nr:hypothetical protein [Pedobacter aquatilis]